MGSHIILSVGRLEIDWGQNSAFADHSALFQPTDLTDVPYYYVDDDDPDYVSNDPDHPWKIRTEYKIGLSKPLSAVVDRIKLLGHSHCYCQHEFTYLSRLNSFDVQRFTFAQISSALSSVDVQSIALDYGSGDHDFGEFFRHEISPRLGLEPTTFIPEYNRYCEGMENLSAYTILTLLSNNPYAKGFPVIWAFDDLETDGCARRDDFVRPLHQSKRFLIVTEGSSDAKIIEHALSLIYPHIADFFDFVDMEEGYPFSGTGNLFRFVQGLISICVLNNVIVIFDNDAEGVVNYKKCCQLNVLDNMSIITLPCLEEFRKFPTVGPEGNGLSDINGRAASIECYLDLKGKGVVRWSSYNSQINEYQGAIAGKDQFKKEFLQQRSMDDVYEYKNIKAVLDLIIETCASMAERHNIADLQQGYIHG